MSRPKLGQLLLSDNACTREALMHAWEQKVLFGDRLGTNLLAGGHVDEKTLALTLGAQHNTRAAYGEVLAPDPRVIRGLSRLIARRHNIVPHHRDASGVYLLMQDPHDAVALNDAAAAFSAPVIPVVVCEARMWTLLNTHYGVEMGLRPIDLDGSAAVLKRLSAQSESPQVQAPVDDLVSEDDFNALYMRVEDPAAAQQDAPLTEVVVDPSPGPEAADAPLLEPEPEGDAAIAESIAAQAFDEPTVTVDGGGSPMGLADPDAEVLDLTPSMETDGADASVSAAPVHDVAAPSIANTAPPARTESAARIEFDATDAAEAAAAAAAGAGEHLQPPPTAADIQAAQERAATQLAAAELAATELAATELAAPELAATELAAPEQPSTLSTGTRAEDQGRGVGTVDASPTTVPAAQAWLPLPTAPAVIFDEEGSEKLDDALFGAVAPPTSRRTTSSLFAAEDEDTPLTFEAATAALTHVRGRSEIARVVIRYALTQFSRAALLTVHPNNVLGWEGIGEGLSTARLSTFRMRRDVESVFALVAKTKAHYLGPLQRWPGNGEWVKHSGRQIPKTVAVFPVLVRGKVVNLFYGDNGHQANVEGDVGELLILMQRISSSYESLLSGPGDPTA